jgi:ATP-dependent Clp protease ATP-binding subunit ClpC
MPEKQQKIQFVICPVCSGTGKNKIGLACSNCSGMGMGAFYNNVFYYWGPKLGAAVIKLRHLKKRINNLVNLFAFSVGLLGILALGWWFWENGPANSELLFFWRFKHWLILSFWMSLFFDMFIFYRLSEEAAAKQKIKKASYNSKRGAIRLPNNWSELKKFKFTVDVSRGFGDKAMDIVEESYGIAKKLKQKQVQIMHLFLTLFKDKAVLSFFSRLNIDKARLLQKVKEQIGRIGEGGKTELSIEVKKVLIEAYLDALRWDQEKVKVLNMVLPCQIYDKVLAEILYELEIDRDKIVNCLAWFRINDKMLEQYRVYRKMARFKPGTNMDRAYTAVATPVLNHFAYDLTLAAKWGRLDFSVAREEEIEDIFQQFQSGHTGVILIGEDGVGKNSIIEGIAQLMVEEDVPKILRDKRLVKLDVSRLVSGATASEAQERLLVIIDEVIRAGNIILYINNIENIVGITSGGEESLDLSEVLAGAIERRSIFCLATATTKNYIKYIEDTPLGNVMADIKIKEPMGNQAIQIIESKVGPLEAKYKVYFSYNALENVIKLSSKYMHDKYLPAKAVELLELVSVKVADSKGEGAIVTKEDIAKVVSEETSIPVSRVTEEESEVLLNMEDKIHERMINQEEAVNMVASSLRRARAELHEHKRPIASFLFLGPTGVGKTELAKTVADIYFGSEKSMIRVDMSEYQHHDSIKKMIGSADGSRGYLTEAVRKAPFSLILLDEFEKAHPDILNLFLQVMDDGRLTDGQGRTVDFTNSIIISTSNAGAVYIQDEVARGTNIERIKEVLINEKLNKIMRPELINRFDGIVVFKPLSEENVVDITRLMLAKISKTLEKKGIRMRAEEEGIRVLARQGYDPKFGARPLRRLLQDKVENVIANKILAGELRRRDTVVIDANADVRVEKREKL